MLLGEFQCTQLARLLDQILFTQWHQMCRTMAVDQPCTVAASSPMPTTAIKYV